MSHNGPKEGKGTPPRSSEPGTRNAELETTPGSPSPSGPERTRRTAAELEARGEFAAALEELSREEPSGEGARSGEERALALDRAELLLFLGLHERAARAVEPLLAAGSRDDAETAEARRLLGYAARAQRRWEKADDLFAAAAKALERLGAAGPLARALLARAELAADRRDIERAAELVLRAREAAARSDAGRTLVGRIVQLAGRAALAKGDLDEAGRAFAVALSAAREAGEARAARELHWLARHGLALLAVARGDDAGALVELEAAEKGIGDLAGRLPDALRRSFLAREDVHEVLVDLAVVRAALRRAGSAAPERKLDDVVLERNALYQFEAVARALAAERDLGRLLALLLDVSIEATGAERGFLVLVEEGNVKFKVARNIDREEVLKPSFKVSHSIIRQAVKTGQSVLTNNAGGDPRFCDMKSVHELALQSTICVPLLAEGRVLGTIYLDHRFQEGVFGKADLVFLESLSAQAALSIENARLVAELGRRRDELERRGQEVSELNLRLAELNLRLEERLQNREQELAAARTELDLAKSELARTHSCGDLVGASPVMQQVFAQIERVAEGDFPVLVLGESGTGKELAARAIHARSARASAAFVSENCGGIPETLLESVLFGHRKGAFTGADRDRAGLFELAHGGTLFLDEIGEMPLEGQKRLLRALQEGEFRPVGSDRTKKVDVRIVAATNRDLAAMAASGKFREDLYYRLHVIEIRLPPLRERAEDIPILVEKFLAEAAGLERSRDPGQGSPRRVEPAVLDLLAAYPWPGNVRELANEVRRWVTFAGDSIRPQDVSTRIARGVPLPRAGTADSERAALYRGKTWKDLEKEMIEFAIAEAGGNKTRAAELLGIPRRTLYDRMKHLGLSGEGERDEARA
ncbi:MAG: sigma-54-dependent Fis family transcriptional regulator [Planctomycetes bacterium]|nr:sigma-54-dependent Fis family transcriptional regulator [Planctomycetota bacterium]